MQRADVTLLEELNFNAWPALRTTHYDGWLLRCTGGDSRRVNSVNSLTPGVLPLDEKIAAAKSIYEHWGRKAIFRLTPLADQGLEEILVARGYALDAPTFVQFAEAKAYQPMVDVQIVDRVDENWIGAALHIRALAAAPGEIFAAQHRAVGVDSRWALVREGDRAVAVGAVAIERGWAGLHGIYVATGARRRGLARAVSEALISCAYDQGARRVWLQVEQNNAAALPLYDSLGFQSAYTYHYRIHPG